VIMDRRRIVSEAQWVDWPIWRHNRTLSISRSLLLVRVTISRTAWVFNMIGMWK
jgi:hypothetical protein